MTMRIIIDFKIAATHAAHESEYWKNTTSCTKELVSRDLMAGGANFYDAQTGLRLAD